MEVLLPGLVLLVVVLFALLLFVPGLAVVLAVALPLWAIVMLARLLQPRPRHTQRATSATAHAALAGVSAAIGDAGNGLVPKRLLREAPHPHDRARIQDAPATRRRVANPLQALASEFRSGEALFAFDRDLTVVAWNKGAAELTGIPADQAVGRPCWQLLCGIDARGQLVCNADCPGARLASQGRLVKGQPLAIKTATGARRTIWLSTITVQAGDQPLTLHLLRNGTEATAENGQPSANPTPTAANQS